jgi:hypothetical protein
MSLPPRWPSLLLAVLLLLPAVGLAGRKPLPPPPPPPPPPPSTCLSQPLLTSLGKSNVLLGGKMEATVAQQAPFDVRYIYLAGGLYDGAQPCSSCLSCTAGGKSCANAAGGCRWWGCWQWDQQAPGQYLRDFLISTATRGQLPMITYYEFLHTSGVAEGPTQLLKAQDIAFMQRYFNDWRFTLKQIGTAPALLHIEPDLWGYAQHLNLSPHLIPAAVGSANPTDCVGMGNTVAGMGQCMIAMVRKYAPNAKVGLHASGWGSKLDALFNTNPLLDVEAEAYKVADFLLATGAAQGDFIVVETSDRDAQWYQVRLGSAAHWWDASNTTLPNFHQAFRWARALSERMGKPHLWWQVPLGNMSLPGQTQKWKDNRLDYFLDHMDQVAASQGLGIVFGEGQSEQTTASTDNGHFVTRAKAYFASGGQPACVTSSP